MFDRVLDLIKQPPHNINVNERYGSGLTPLHMTSAGGALVSILSVMTINDKAVVRVSNKPVLNDIYAELCRN